MDNQINTILELLSGEDVRRVSVVYEPRLNSEQYYATIAINNDMCRGLFSRSARGHTVSDAFYNAYVLLRGGLLENEELQKSKNTL